jgi:hypothetical protein
VALLRSGSLFGSGTTDLAFRSACTRRTLGGEAASTSDCQPSVPPSKNRRRDEDPVIDEDHALFHAVQARLEQGHASSATSRLRLVQRQIDAAGRQHAHCTDERASSLGMPALLPPGQATSILPGPTNAPASVTCVARPSSLPSADERILHVANVPRRQHCRARACPARVQQREILDRGLNVLPPLPPPPQACSGTGQTQREINVENASSRHGH